MKNPNGFGTVTKLSGKRRKPWVVKVTTEYDDITGKQKQKSIGTFVTRPEAIQHLAVYNATKQNEALKTVISNDKIFSIESKLKDIHTLRECMEAVIEKGKSKRSNSWFRCRKSATNLLSNILDKNIATLELNDIQKEFDVLIAQKKSKPALNCCKTQMIDAYRYAIINKWITKDDDYTRYIDCQSIADTGNRHTPFNRDEIKIILEDNSFMAKIVIVYIATGCRASELLDTELFNGYIVCGMKTKNGKNRKIPIHSYIEPFIEEVLNYLKTKTYNQLNYDYNKYMISLKLKHNMHDTRYTFATLGKEFRMVNTSIKKIMGHSLHDITEDIYTHESIEYLKDEIEKIKLCSFVTCPLLTKVKQTLLTFKNVD